MEFLTIEHLCDTRGKSHERLTSSQNNFMPRGNQEINIEKEDFQAGVP